MKTGRLRSCQQAAHWLVPSIHLTLPFPPSRQPQPWRAASSRGSGEQVGGLGRAAEAMEASAGDDRDPGDLGAHRPAAPTAAASGGGGRGGEARAARGSRRDGAPGRQPAPRGFLAAAAQLSAAGGLGCPVSPPAFTRPCLCVFPHRRRLLIRARQLQPRLQRRCAKRGRSRESRRAAERQWTQVRRPRPSPEGALRCTRRAGGRGPLATARCGRITQRAPAEEGLTVTHSYPPFIPPPPRPQTVKITNYRMLIAAGKMPKVGD